MGVLADHQIEKLAIENGMITPFAPGQVRPGVISYGTSSYGYDVRGGYKWDVFSPIHATCIDPKNFDKRLLERIDVSLPEMDCHEFEERHCKWCGVSVDNKFADEPSDKPGSWLGNCNAKKRESQPDHVMIPPNSFALGESIEEFNIPRDILVVCLGKSTYARCGVIINVTPGEPEWKGKWTIEVSNTTPLPAKIYCGEGLMQALFLRADKVCKVSYKDRKGKYQNQTGLTPPKVQQ